MKQFKRARPLLLALFCCAIWSSRAFSGFLSLTFDETPPGVTHGNVITNQFLATHGIVISAENFSKTFDLAVIYDSEYLGMGYGRDPDLERQSNQGNGWSMGNIAKHEVLGNLLIIAENNQSASNPGKSDDEGARPAGNLKLRFDVPITAVGFDLVDIEGSSEMLNGSGYVAVAKHSGNEIGRVRFGDFVDSSSAYYISTVKFGNKSANRISPLSFGGRPFDEIVFNMGGSGGITNIVYSPVPEPSSAVLILIGSVGIAGIRRRRARLEQAA